VYSKAALAVGWELNGEQSDSSLGENLDGWRTKRHLPRAGNASGSCNPGYCTVRATVVEFVMAVTPLLDCPVTVTVYVPAGVAGLMGGPWWY
jgi:hypothetical protein